jgi:TatD DNase family protein
VIDFHCHLDLYPEPRKMVEECGSRALYVLSVTTTPSAWEGTRALAGESKRIRTALGLHPQLAAVRKSELPLFERILPDARYVGEIGLDGSHEFKDSWTDQLGVFETILDACARAGGRILSIHSRRAASATNERLAAFSNAGTPVLHWFSGSLKELSRSCDLGCWFSVSPTMLQTAKGRQLVSRMPRDRVLTESDGPFAQLGGRSAFPWEVASAVNALAELWNQPLEGVNATLVANLRKLVECEPTTG